MDEKRIKMVAFLWVVFACIAAWFAASALSPAVQLDAGEFGFVSPAAVAALTIVFVLFWGVAGVLLDSNPVQHATLSTVFLIINHCAVYALPGLAGWISVMIFAMLIVAHIGVSEILK